MTEIDLSRLAAGYDHRAPGPGDLMRANAAATGSGLQAGHVALDIGGGRGAHAAVFAATGASALVVDRSPEMVSIACTIDGVDGVLGDASRLPLRDGRAQLVYFHLSIHHGDAASWLKEAARVATPGGHIWVWTLHHDHHRTSFLARWFPSVGPLDEQRFPDPAMLGEIMDDLGLEAIEHAEAVDRKTPTVDEWEAAVRARFVSTIQLLSEDELEAGLQRFREAHPDPSERLDYSLRYRRLSGIRPSLAS